MPLSDQSNSDEEVEICNVCGKEEDPPMARRYGSDSHWKCRKSASFKEQFFFFLKTSEKSDLDEIREILFPK